MEMKDGFCKLLAVVSVYILEITQLLIVITKVLY